MCGHTEPANNKKNQSILIISFTIISIFMIVEVIGGLMTNSLALLSDAGHMFSDSLSMLVAIIAFSYGAKKSNEIKTYGYKRFEVLAALFNGLSLLVIAIIIIIEAIERFKTPTEITSLGMLIISIIGLLVNIAIAYIMVKKADVKDNINMKGAYLHVLGDMLGSIGAIIASLCILFFDFTWADPVMSILIALIISKSGFSVIKDSIHILMESSPQHISVDEVKEIIFKHREINTIYDIHLWTITSNIHAFTARIIVHKDLTLKDTQSLLKDLENELERLGISHTTLQIEINHEHKEKDFCDLKMIENHNHHHHHH